MGDRERVQQVRHLPGHLGVNSQNFIWSSEHHQEYSQNARPGISPENSRVWPQRKISYKNKIHMKYLYHPCYTNQSSDPQYS